MSPELVYRRAVLGDVGEVQRLVPGETKWQHAGGSTVRLSLPTVMLETLRSYGIALGERRRKAKGKLRGSGKAWSGRGASFIVITIQNFCGSNSPRWSRWTSGSRCNRSLRRKRRWCPWSCDLGPGTAPVRREQHHPSQMGISGWRPLSMHIFHWTICDQGMIFRSRFEKRCQLDPAKIKHLFDEYCYDYYNDILLLILVCSKCPITY